MAIQSDLIFQFGTNFFIFFAVIAFFEDSF